MNFTGQESHCAQLKLYIQTSQQNDWECCSVSPTFLSCHVHFMIATVDSPGQVERGREGRKEGVESERRKERGRRYDGEGGEGRGGVRRGKGGRRGRKVGGEKGKGVEAEEEKGRGGKEGRGRVT